MHIRQVQEMEVQPFRNETTEALEAIEAESLKPKASTPEALERLGFGT